MKPVTSPSFNAEDSRRSNQIGTWLRQERTRLHLNQKELAAALLPWGVVVSGGAISKWEAGDHIPTPYQLQALCCAMAAQGPFSDSENHLHGLNAAGREKISDYIRDLSASGLYRQEENTVAMRVYELPASAGTGLLLDGEDYSMLSFPESSIPSGADFGIRVRGDSMEPRYHDGQLVWVKRQNNLREGEIGIFVLDGEAFLKQLRYRAPTPQERESYGSGIGTIAVLQSLNPAYPPRRISPTQRLDLVGRVLS